MALKTNYGDLAITIDPRTGRAKRAVGSTDTPARPPKAPPDDRPRYRSKTEARYAGQLEVARATGQIREARYEAFQVTLATRTTLTADFWVVMPDMTVEIHEVKGKWHREDGWIKLKIAAAHWPWFRWFRVIWEDGQWTKTRVPSQ